MPQTHEQEIITPDVNWQEETPVEEDIIKKNNKPPFVCECDEWHRPACEDLPFYKEHKAKRFCLLHYPGKEKSEDFRDVFFKKLKNKNFNFRGVWFPEKLGFANFEFNKRADFTEATFNGIADFSGTIFKEGATFASAKFTQNTGAIFRDTVFNIEAAFNNAEFLGEAIFDNTTFEARTYFANAIFNERTNFRQARFQAEIKADFSGIIFGDGAYFTEAIFNVPVDFRSTKFLKNKTSDNYTDFTGATFNADAYFSNAMFNVKAEFCKVLFRENSNHLFIESTFNEDVRFSNAIFKSHVQFNQATFSARAAFDFATFNTTVDFRGSKFLKNAKANFNSASLKDHIIFRGATFSDTSLLDLQFSSIDKPERVSFHSVALHPHWFINVDARKFEFAQVKWYSEKKEFFWRFRLANEEIKTLKTRDLESPYELFSIACRRLAVNAEENNRYEEASDFRYMAMDAQRLETWRGWAIWKLRWWYWFLSGYGEDLVRASIVLLLILLIFALFYMEVGLEKPIDGYFESVIYSLNVVALQKPEPKAITTWAKFCVGIETIFGPLQIALLALAIRRKFMR